MRVIEVVDYDPEFPVLTRNPLSTSSSFSMTQPTSILLLVHVCAKGHREIFDKLAFRDYLRAHSNKAAAYGELKRRIAAQYRLDNIEYMHAKDDFVKSTLLEARRWYELNSC